MNESSPVTGIINELPIEKMVSAPLLAAINAQAQMSMQMAKFIDNVGIDKDGNIRMVTFKYEETSLATTDANDKPINDPNTNKPVTTTRYIQAPFLAMTGIPNMAIENVNISFELEVNTATDVKSSTSENVTNETTASYKSWWSPVEASTKFTGSVTHSNEQTRHTDTRAKYSFNVLASKQPAPESFLRIIEAVTNAATKPTDKALTDNLMKDGHGAAASGGNTDNKGGGGTNKP
jgi:hypothetical protein